MVVKHEYLHWQGQATQSRQLLDVELEPPVAVNQDGAAGVGPQTRAYGRWQPEPHRTKTAGEEGSLAERSGIGERECLNGGTRASNDEGI